MTKNNFGKAVWQSFAKAKEKQSNALSNALLLHICFCPTRQQPRQVDNFNEHNKLAA